jgi:glycerol-3-phosphate dehydrogenase (NAD(P)+)
MTLQHFPTDISKTRIGVVGAGSWGTALADLLARKGFIIDLWVFEPEIRDAIETRRENPVFLPGASLSENLIPDNDLAKVVSRKDLVLVVTPSHVMRAVCNRMAPDMDDETVVVSASKGIENVTHLTMSGIIEETLPRIAKERIAVLSGPSFAKEVARNVPTVVTAASRDPEVARFVQEVFATPVFRVYTSDDRIGVELGGSVKNVIAIAAGIIDGLGLGLNTRAALITRGMAEMRRLGVAMGANPRTFTGSAGIGDLVLTCTGDLSRNHTVGKKIGQGMRLSEILSEMRMVAEGVKTAKSVYNLSRKLGVEMPISEEVYRVLYEDVDPKEALHRLMTRDLRQELDER